MITNVHKDQPHYLTKRKGKFSKILLVRNGSRTLEGLGRLRKKHYTFQNVQYHRKSCTECVFMQ